ncbi:Rha family transcriptional regulator [Jeotgalibacillus soli]|uniref:Phage anti-repressor protein n=1 Tax=Jeotgalibacillus soli TaxID=889306 RepID=A0A0C2VKQ7_9BACL|nr:Rha family transcriptional regulator [Jeotgalibacillus soli]KIL45011.1 phage anti-repressor protein [Jeotgalibacillus soli]
MNLVIMQDQQAVTSTTTLALSFNKEHRNVMRDIENLKKDVLNFEQMFFETTEPDSYNRSRKVYLMNRDGFTLLAMGFTGSKTDKIKKHLITQVPSVFTSASDLS